jgi:hypothetical protein
MSESGFRLLRRTDAGYAKGVSVRQLLRQYKLRSLREYQIDARRQINSQRQTERAPARHGTVVSDGRASGTRPESAP